MKELNRFPKETIIHYNKNFDFNQLKKADNCLNEKEIDIFLNQSLWSSRAEAILKPKLYTAKTKELKYNIIMLSYNTNELTKNAIIKLHENSFHGFNLFVLDNNSNDGSQAMLFDLYRNKLIDGLILNNKNSGFGRSNNIVFNTFNNNLKHTLFINSDTVVSENFDEHIFNWFIDNVGVVACSGDNIGAVNNPQRNNNKTGIIELERFSGFAFFILNSLFKKLNGFDEQFFCYFEDDDLSIRVTKEGYKIICDYSCFVHHEMGKSNSDLKAHELIFQDSRAKFLQKWPKAEVVR
jgi:GT2 family glycosyltransferase